MKNNRAISKVLSAVLILLTAVFLMLPGALQVSAYSSTYTDDDFTLEIPDEWYQGYNTAWGDVNGNSVNVNITSAPGFYTYDQIYSQEMLDELEKMMENDMEEYKEDIKEQMQSTYGEVMSEEDISDFVDSIHVDDIEAKEISTFTKNDYPCLHVIMTTGGTIMGEDITMRQEMYQTYSNSKIYTVAASGDLSDQALLDTVDSFTLNDYNPPAAAGFSTEDSDSSDSFDSYDSSDSYDTGSGSDDDVFGSAIKKGAVTGVMYALVFGGIGLIIGKLKKGKKDKGEAKTDQAAQIAPEEPVVEPVSQAMPEEPVVEPVSQAVPEEPAVRPAPQETPAAVQFPRMKMCPNCGKISNSNFCPVCGTAIPDIDVR